MAVMSQLYMTSETYGGYVDEGRAVSAAATLQLYRLLPLALRRLSGSLYDCKRKKKDLEKKTSVWE